MGVFCRSSAERWSIFALGSNRIQMLFDSTREFYLWFSRNTEVPTIFQKEVVSFSITIYVYTCYCHDAWAWWLEGFFWEAMWFGNLGGITYAYAWKYTHSIGATFWFNDCQNWIFSSLTIVIYIKNLPFTLCRHEFLLCWRTSLAYAREEMKIQLTFSHRYTGDCQEW